MNRFYDLPSDIIKHILFFVKTSYCKTIINAWRRYFKYKLFIFNAATLSPVIHSFYDNRLVFIVASKYTHFYFNKLNFLITGREHYFHKIYSLYLKLAHSIYDYEMVSCADNFYYAFNKFFCIQSAFKFNWDEIVHIIS